MYAYRRVLKVRWIGRRKYQSILGTPHKSEIINANNRRKVRYIGHITRRNNSSAKYSKGKWKAGEVDIDRELDGLTTSRIG